MGAWVHRLSRVNLETMTGTCSNCGPITVYRSGNSVRCSVSKRATQDAYVKRGGIRSTPNRRRKFAAERGHCDACGFVAIASCQLDVDHRDDDWTNDTENWQVLCANCHRLKTYQPETFAQMHPANV
jgi:hypothetical protein